ncbi:exocyst complex subunit Sec15-like-domain-containing protein [Mycena leptocephala]|nr:exocyst complex subunit Sec15-like-domain-containing protein [Mycena leptocephala]
MAFTHSSSEECARLLETQFNRRFDDIVQQDDLLPMLIESDTEIITVLEVVWISEEEKQAIQLRNPVPYHLPWSQTFYLCCQDIREFIQQFVEGVSQDNINELLIKSLEELLNHISQTISQRLAKGSILSQIAQIVTNLEYFQVLCAELPRSLSSVAQIETITLAASSSFENTLSRALARINDQISAKVEDFFELSEYDWTPQGPEAAPSMYLYELVNWLTTVVDSLVIKEKYKDTAYTGAASYIADCLMDFLTGRGIPMMNENAISNILIDVDFLEEELRRIGRGHLSSVFVELRTTTSIPLTNAVQEYLVHQTSYVAVKPKRLQALLDKLAKYGESQQDAPARQLGDQRRKEADAVDRLVRGGGR